MAPQIAVYDAPEGGLRPTETGIHATEAAARRVTGAYSESAELTKGTGARIGSAIETAGKQVADHITQAQISLGAAGLAGLTNQYTKEWHDINKTANPNDPTVAPNFLGKLEGELQTFKKGFFTAEGQQWAESQVERFRSQMYKQTAADRAAAEGQARIINADTAKTGNANSAFWAGTEQGTRDAVDRWKATGLPKAVIDDGISEIVSKGALGAIKANAQVPEWIKKEEFSKYVDAEKLQKASEQQVRENTQAEKRIRSQNEYAIKQQWNSEADKIYRDTLPVNNSSRPQLPPDINDRMAKLQPGDDAPPGISRAYKALTNHVNAIAERLNKPEPNSVVSHRAYMSVVDQIHNGQITDLSEIDSVGEKLTTSDYNSARKELDLRKSDDGIRLSDHKRDFLAAVKPAITKGLDDVLNPAVGLRFYDFQSALNGKIAEYIRDKKDPHSLMNPDSPDYMGRPEVLQRYESTMTQQMQQNPAVTGRPVIAPTTVPAQPTAPAPQPDSRERQAGESLSAWVERTRTKFKPAAAPAVPMSQ